ncbi:hypothetical protein [Priestia endophytica]|uniref:hypothetical protein n=1 Tax=Priestia endophytica TaxID=135735 RepID=UPI0022822A74|nr:hypothetical protein [Priestia endophytica]MCY8234526.1 hypothetical protein [Priestia endophytica]
MLKLKLGTKDDIKEIATQKTQADLKISYSYLNSRYKGEWTLKKMGYIKEKLV